MTAEEMREAAAQAVMDFTETGDLRNVARGARWVPRVAVAAAIRAIPIPPAPSSPPSKQRGR